LDTAGTVLSDFGMLGVIGLGATVFIAGLLYRRFRR
jgi:hypothetical protein